VVTEPDGKIVPAPASESQDYAPPEGRAAVPSGVTLREISLPALFEFFGENINYQNDAIAEPQTFSPQCGFTGTLVLHGGGCKVEFGWYNVDTPNDIYPLVTLNDYAQLPSPIFYPRIPLNATSGGCKDPPTCTGWANWKPVKGTPLTAISTDPRYRGGFVGLAMRGDPTTACAQTKYSEPKLNQAYDKGGNWISMVMWKSTWIPDAYYVGVEDLPMAPNSFAGYPGQQYTNDGDFNDFVYLIQGVTCAGGGQPCSLAGEGACALGLTECDAQGKLFCQKQMSESAEVCDNIDNDCNGLVDDNAPCPADKICWRGTCVPNCAGGEFPCSGGLVCDESNGLCVDPKCLNNPCKAGEVCFGGECFGGCEGVICPEGQTCKLGRCFDACAVHAPCPTGQLCEGGVCVQRCQCRVCPGGRECASDGHCVLQGCADPTTRAPLACGSAGDGQPKLVCSGGQCVNICQGVICPGSGKCDDLTGTCGAPIGLWKPQPITGSGGGGFIVDSNPGASTLTGSGGGGTRDPMNQLAGASSTGCGCRVAGQAPLGLGGFFGLGLGLGLAYTRRRRAA
jgi:hypothetical protein